MKNSDHKLNYLLASALEIAPLGWWEWDLIHDKLQLSKEVFALIDRNSEEFDGTIEFIVNNVIDKSYRKLIKDNIQKAIVTGVVPGFEYLINKSDGTTAWIIINGYALKDNEGKFTHLLGTILDITERKIQEKKIKDQNSFYEALMKIIPSPIFYKNQEGLYTYCNDAFSQYIGMSKDNIIGSSVYDVAPDELAEVYHQADLDVMADKNIQVYEANVKYADDSIHDVVFTKSAHLNDQNEAIGLVGLMHDITKRKKNERQIDKQNLIKDVIINLSQRISEFNTEMALYDEVIIQLLHVFNHADSGTVLKITEDDEFVIEASYKYDKTLASEFKIPVKSSFIWRHSHGKMMLPGIVNNIDQLVKNKTIPQMIPTRSNYVLKSNLYIPLWIDGHLSKVISLNSGETSMFTDLDLFIATYIQEQILIIHKLYQLNQQTIKLSRYDSLTDFMNRRFFEAIFEDRLKTASRNHGSLTVVLFDLDRLKKINDDYGHSEGDEYIRQFAHLLTASFRSSDQFARIGGDEFCGIFLDSDLALLTKKLNRIRETYANIPFGDRHSEFIGRFSYGVASYPEDGKTANDLMYTADLRMYQDKNEHKKKLLIKK